MTNTITTTNNDTPIKSVTLDTSVPHHEKVNFVAPDGKNRSISLYQFETASSYAKTVERLSRDKRNAPVLKRYSEKYDGKDIVSVAIGGEGIFTFSRDLHEKVMQHPYIVAKEAARKAKLARDVELEKKAQRYDDIHNEGGGGYNPYRLGDGYTDPTPMHKENDRGYDRE